MADHYPAKEKLMPGKFDDNETLESMYKFGGSFASALSEAARKADYLNYQKLKFAFPELWEEHEEMAKLHRRKKLFKSANNEC